VQFVTVVEAHEAWKKEEIRLKVRKFVARPEEAPERTDTAL
jgi:hypothetical protein